MDKKVWKRTINERIILLRAEYSKDDLSEDRKQDIIAQIGFFEKEWQKLQNKTMKRQPNKELNYRPFKFKS